MRNKAYIQYYNQKFYPIKWAVDTTKLSTLNFKGFEADTIISEVTGLSRQKYDRKRPFTKEVKYQNYFTATDSVKIPEAYIVKKG